MGILDNLRIGAITGLTAAAAGPVQKLMEGKLQEAGELAIRGLTGYSPQHKNWKPERMATGLVPIAVGTAVSYGAAKSGVNRYLPKGIKL